MNSKLIARLKKIKLIVTDFDGVWTDNTVIHSENGLEAVVRSKEDSLGIDLLNDAGLYNKVDYHSLKHEVDIVIISRETNPIVKSVADKINVKYTQSLYKKDGALKEEVEKRDLDYSQVLYIGNDLNDIACMRDAGIAVAVKDSRPMVLEVADYVTKKTGGRGAFREICDLILNSRKVK